MILESILVVLAYLSGSLASAIIVCKLMRLPDPRAQGSGNPGATNVLRIGGKFAAALTLAGDVLKGLGPVLLAGILSDAAPAAAACAVAAFLGHLYPVFFRFQGGKGVATAFGVVTALAWPVALCMGITWITVAGLSRYSSLSSISAAVLAPAFALVLRPEPAVVAALAVIAVLLVWRHRANIQRLLAGTESRIGGRA